jgi:hypothetical protein
MNPFLYLLIPPLFAFLIALAIFSKVMKKNRFDTHHSSWLLPNHSSRFLSYVVRAGGGLGLIAYGIVTNYCNDGFACLDIALMAGSLGSAIGVLLGLVIWLL